MICKQKIETKPQKNVNRSKKHPKMTSLCHKVEERVGARGLMYAACVKKSISKLFSFDMRKTRKDD